MTDAPPPGNPPAPNPPGRQEPRFDPAGEYAVLMRDRARDSEATLATERAARAAAEAKLAEADAAATAKIKAAEQTGNERLMRAELRVFAKAAGIVDLDVLKLVDLKAAGVKLGDDGEVTGAAEAIEALKKAKPYAFTQTAGDKGNTSSTNPSPPAPPAAGKDAKQMTHDEWRAARAALIQRR